MRTKSEEIFMGPMRYNQGDKYFHYRDSWDGKIQTACLIK